MLDSKKSKKVNIEIDNKNFEVYSNKTIIQVADDNNIYIPRFCYHKKLSLAANCRMCLVDVEGAKRSSPACATPVMQGMKVRTRSPKTIQMQKDMMEFLLINHPLDCPICDQGGECELQDNALEYGKSYSKYKETKRVVPDPSLGSLISTDMTRCILCTRCVRFGEEIAGVKELGVIGRGDYSKISTYIDCDMVDSEISGNIIDLCPVGALTSKPFRFKARSWEIRQLPTVSAGDALCADISAHIYQDKLVRVVPRETETSYTWISDRDRFEYYGLYSSDRIKQPMIKKSRGWIEVSWKEALNYIKVLFEETIQKHGVDQIAAIVSEDSTSEEMYLVKKILQSLGSNNIDARIRQNTNTSGVSAGEGLSCSAEELESADFILILGSNLRKEYPLLNYSVKKAAESGAQVFAWNMCEYDFNYRVTQIKFSADNFEYLTLSLLKALLFISNISYGALYDKLKNINPSNIVREVADIMIKAEYPIILIGQEIIMLDSFDAIFSIFKILENAVGIKGGFLSPNVNSHGAIKSSIIPGFSDDVSDFSTKNCLAGQTSTKLLMLVNTEVIKDSSVGAEKIKKSLDNIDIVMLFSAFADGFTRENVDIIIPISTHYETSGSFVNIFGKIKEFKQVVRPYAENKELWRVLRIIGNLLNLEGFEYNNIKEVTFETYRSLQQNNGINYASKILSVSSINNKRNYCFIVSNSMYLQSALVRRSRPLAKTKDSQRFLGVRISRYIANELGLKESGKIIFYNTDNKIESHVIVDDALHAKNIMIPREDIRHFLFSKDINIKILKQGN